MNPGEYLLASEPVELNAGRPTRQVVVANTGDRPIQVGSTAPPPTAAVWTSRRGPRCASSRANNAR